MSKTDNWKCQYCDTINIGESVKCEVCGRKRPDESVLAETEESMFTLDMFPDIPLIPINSFWFKPPELDGLSNGQCWFVTICGILFCAVGNIIYFHCLESNPFLFEYEWVEIAMWVIILPALLTFVVYQLMRLSRWISFKNQSERFNKRVYLLKNTADFIEKKDSLSYNKYRIAKRGNLGLITYVCKGYVELVLNPEYSQITVLKGADKDMLKIVKDGRVGIFSLWKILINTEYDDVALWEEDKRYLLLKNNELFGLYCLFMQKIIVPVAYDTIWLYKNGIIKALVNSRCYYFDEYGNILH